MLLNLKKGLLALTLLTAVIGCKKNTIDYQNGGVDERKIYQKPITYDQIELVSNLEKITLILEDLYKEKKNLKLVNASIYAKSYTDESVLLKDLINPIHSILPGNKKFIELCSKWNVSLQDFSEAFWKAARGKNDTQLLAFLNFIQNKHLSIQNLSNGQFGVNGQENSYDVSIYFPYSSEFDISASGDSYGPVSSLVAASAEADEALGYQPYYSGGVLVNYQPVVVNDDYVFSHPTHIVGVNGIEPYETQDAALNPPTVTTPANVNRVYVGDAICKVQYDRLISFTGNGGGSEIAYCRVSGYLKLVGHQITEFEDKTSVKFERGTIRKKQWLRVYAVWDADWVVDNKEQVFAIYEDDNNSEITFTGSLSTRVKIADGTTVDGSIDYQIKRSSQDEIIKQLKISRVSYFAGALRNQGWGYGIDKSFLPASAANGWPFYDAVSSGGANVGWTWPYDGY
ncbi:MAG: hypothetical protein RL070_1375 [Bacteroidota bacterium]|jgi:hypothetical protein